MSAMREKHAALVEQQQVEAGRALAAQAAEHAETMAAAVRSVMGDGVRDGGRQRAKWWAAACEVVGGSVWAKACEMVGGSVRRWWAAACKMVGGGVRDRGRQRARWATACKMVGGSVRNDG